MAEALRVSTDQLVGIKTPKQDRGPRTVHLLQRLHKVEQLSATD